MKQALYKSVEKSVTFAEVFTGSHFYTIKDKAQKPWQMDILHISDALLIFLFPAFCK
ncbi:hypothetical protein Syn7502_01265 [Synechococcus sp. PCC 7502]|nr:hypothetical protein Syn7502_01265 [Synechococcus sp. PCC 7502]